MACHPASRSAPPEDAGPARRHPGARGLFQIKKVADRCAILCRGKLVDILDVAGTSLYVLTMILLVFFSGKNYPPKAAGVPYGASNP